MNYPDEMKMNKDELMKQIMATDFAEHELTLFLDTHPEDKKALELHRSVAQKLKMLKEMYNEQFAPITSTNSTDPNEWTWISNPWPWENK